MFAPFPQRAWTARAGGDIESRSIDGHYVPVRAGVHMIEGSSVHADAAEITDWLRRAPRPPEACYVVHGEERASEALRHRIETALGWTTVVPGQGEIVRLD